MRLATAYNIAIGVASAANARVTPIGIHEVRMAATADCYITIGAPTAAATLTTSTLIRAGVAGEVFGIAAGEQVFVIAGVAGGTLNVTEMTY